MLPKYGLLALFAGIMLPLTTTIALAQYVMPPETEKRLREIGRVTDPQATRPLYAPLQEQEPYQGIRVTRELEYGPDARQRVDVFEPHEKAGARPVLLFMHGGAYVGGTKHFAGTPFYSNIGVWAVRNGMVGVNMTYRLAPQHQWPSAQQDIAAALAWVHKNVSQHGGDPSRVFLMGHSAGASHVGMYVAHKEFHGPQGPGIVGAILVSAYYDLTVLDPKGSQSKYFGEDASRYPEQSSLSGLLATKVPLRFFVAEFDNPEFNRQADLLKAAFCKQERCPQLDVLPKHSHMSEIYSVNTDDKGMTDQILAFMRSVK